MKYTLYGLVLATVMVWSYNIGQLTPKVVGSDHSAVKAICDYSRTVTSSEWEDACGVAQDSTLTKYQCVSNQCTIEDK